MSEIEKEKPVERKAECAIGFKTDAAHEQMLVDVIKHRRQTRRAFFETAIEIEHRVVVRERMAKGVA